MKNLITAITAEQKQNLETFIIEINKLTELEQLDTWYYNELLPKGKRIANFSFNDLKAYLITRKEKQIYKSIEKEANKIKTVMNAGKLLSVKVSIEWKKSRMWGSNPTAEAWCSFIDKDGNHHSRYVNSGSIGGCGYDKESTAVARCLNQFNEVLKPLYKAKNTEVTAKNHDLLGYGSGYGILPSIEGGVGTNCYNRIFEKIGYEFKKVASGKTFDVYIIEKL